MSEKHWDVSVSRDGENILTIGDNYLSGRDLGQGDEDTIRTAATHLLAFIGDHPALPSPPQSAIVAAFTEGFNAHIRGARGEEGCAKAVIEYVKSLQREPSK